MSLVTAVRRLERKLDLLWPDVTITLDLDEDVPVPVLYLDLIIVDEEHLRGQGLGTEVLVEICKLTDAKRWILASQPARTDLEPWYLRHGFVFNRKPYRKTWIETTMYRLPDVEFDKKENL